MSSSCDTLIDYAANGGTCGRPGKYITAGGGEDTTSYCQTKFGDQNKSQWCASSSSGVCHRIVPPLANRWSCCTGASNGFDTCGNVWCPDSVECREPLGQYCSDPANVGTAVCQRFCDKTENKQFCDDAMRKFCNDSPDNAAGNPLCACISSLIPSPACMDQNCIQGGYKTTDHVRQTQSDCPQMCALILHCGGDADGTDNCTVDENVANMSCHRPTTSAMLTSARSSGPSNRTLMWQLLAMLIVIIGLLLC
ncbi:hypothetical protein [Medusavirus stheno T3]|uniref:Uncharacterized protein n=1 Tax=Medusavirus stheno T3 TaxID=3069717 RepID=A0A7S7YFT3_9VIRU|nr:hypothetical protein QKU73_gp126 [Acanthamoeba castellanii medusavirus]QPB44307.1 hypothetical protein [Medusavirus stheno T3]